MFTFSFKEMLVDICKHLEAAPNAEALFKGVMGIKSLQSSYHLMVRYKGTGNSFTKAFLASKYIASKLLGKCNASTFRTAYDLASHHANPAFLGWVVEFDFISQMMASVETTNTLDFVNADGSKSAVTWQVPEVIDFNPDDDLDISAIPFGTWLKPVKWNQEGYDLTGLFQDSGQQGQSYLRFVQITNAAEHGMNLLYFRQLTDKVEKILGKKVGVEIILVSPVDTRGRSPTKIKVKFGDALNKTTIGATANVWTSECVETSILRPFFVRQRA